MQILFKPMLARSTLEVLNKLVCRKESEKEAEDINMEKQNVENRPGAVTQEKVEWN